MNHGWDNNNNNQLLNTFNISKFHIINLFNHHKSGAKEVLIIVQTLTVTKLTERNLKQSLP